MIDTVMARLVGGPFDGDEGRVRVPLPDMLWAFACGGACTPGGRCRLGGIHWARDGRPWARTSEAVIYRRGPVDDGVQVYVHRNRELQSREQRADETPAEDLARAA